MNVEDAVHLLKTQPLGTYYITDNPYPQRQQSETICLKISDSEWKECHPGNTGCSVRVWTDDDIAEEIYAEDVSWAFS